MIYYKKLLFLSLLLPVFISFQVECQELSDNIEDMLSEELIALIKKDSLGDSYHYEEVLIKKTEQKDLLIDYYFNIGKFCYDQEDFARAEYYLKKGITVAKQINHNEYLCKLYLKLGNTYLGDWKDQKALDAYYAALDIIEQKGNKEHEIKANSGIVIIRKRMKQLDKALEICRYTIKLTEQSSFKNQKNHVNMLTILSEIFLDKQKYDSVIHYADIGIAMSRPINHYKGEIDLHAKKGAAFFKKNEVPSAFKSLTIAEKIIIENNIADRKSILNVNYFLANYFYKQNEYENSIVRLNKTLKVIDEDDYGSKRTLEIFRLMADSYNALGNEQKAAFWFQKYTKLRDRFLEEKDKTVNKMHNKDTEKLGDQIKELKTKQDYDTKVKKYGVLFSVVFLIGLVVITFLYYKKQKVNINTFNELIQKISELESKETEETVADLPKEIPREIIIDDEKVEKVLKGLTKLEEQEYFLNPECNLRAVGKKVKTNATYLSKIINTYKGKSFNDYINDFRIDYVLHRLKNDKKFRSFSIKSIAAEIGYKSENSFTKHFKRKTGLNPSYYIKNIEKLG